MARIAVDIDSTLYDFVALARGVMGEMGGQLRKAAYAEWSEWRTPMDIAGDAWPDVVELCHKPDVILAQEPFPGAAEVLEELSWHHEIVYASNRDPSTQEPTRRWLSECGFPEGDVRCHTDDKLSMVRDCQYLIDDRPKTLVQFLYAPRQTEERLDYGRYVWDIYMGGATERKAFGLVTPYNRALTDVPGIYLAPTWPLLAAYLRAKVSGSVRTN